MPHAIEMPAVVSDEVAPMHRSTRNSHELPIHVRPSYEKTNGSTKSPSHTSINGGTGSGVGDGGGLDGEVKQVNGDGILDTNLNSIPNGRSSASSWDQKPSRNGSSLSVNGGWGHNGAVTENESGRRTPQSNGVPRASNGDSHSPLAFGNGNIRTSGDTVPKPRTNGSSIDYATTNEPFHRVDVPGPVSTNPQSTGPLTYTSSLTSTSPINESPSKSGTGSPHRFSSPPSYAAPLAPSPSTGSLQHSGPPTLKHRHTLQVPKLGPGRGSKDGEETAFTTGRFSPTNLPQGTRRTSLSLNRRNTQSIHSNMPHEEIPPDEDALRWAEAVRQKRASKRKRKDDEEDDRVVVGTKVDQNHVNWVTAYNMLTGIRFTVSRTNAKLDRPLTDADFDARHKFSFDITGNELTPSAKYDFKFKDYAPWVFRHLRANFKLDPADYLMSLTSKYILSELGSPGKSGSFFYFSRDYKYIIKTIHHAEHKFLRKILREYYSHVEQNPNTLLSQFYGLHRVKIPYGRKIHFVVMNNLFPPHRDIHQTFDLKGSTVGRDFREEDLEKNPRATLKDLNWLRRNLHLEFGPEKKTLFIEQMEKDVALLQKLNIMDYSMLVGVHDLQKGNEENLRDKTLRVFQPGGDSPAEDADLGPGRLMRTPSKLENIRKARELRQIIKQEKPIPMGQSSSRMPDQMEENHIKKEFTFYSDDGGFRATHEDNSPGEEIFFLSIIDCLTHYGTIKKLEHLWKGLSHDKKLISPIRPEPYGERFMRFIEGITKSPEEAARETVTTDPKAQQTPSTPIDTTNPTNINDSFTSRRRSGSTSKLNRTVTNNSTLQRNESQAVDTNKKGDEESERPEPRTLGVVRSPSAERSGGLQGQTLPVVEEAGEGGSTNGGRSVRSGASGEREKYAGGERPVTPAKDEKWINGSVRGSIGSSPGTNGLLSPTLRTKISRSSLARSSLDKELPALPGSEGKGKGMEKDR